ncbi:MAG: DHHA1 domain-containing protein, partial [Planctomycetota bacterium]|nr:DHHA1 domain-containing protein [Planctomycetota bacterium]
GENRVIARFGLDRIKRSPLHGLRALVDASGLGGANIDTWDCGFKLAPRLNACGRMAHAREAVEMLTTADPKRAAEIAAELSRLNTERRLVERRIFEQAAEMAVQAGMTGEDRRAIVLAHPEWHAGVVGIVCSRLVERFGRPTILMADREGVCHGSGRSIDGFNLHAGLHACADVLDKFGGHDMAAGLALQSARLPELVDRFTAVANERISPEELTPVLHIDAAARAADLSLTEVRRVEALAPFGRGNPPVAVMLKGAVIDAAPVPLGSGGRHLALVVRDGEAPATAPGARTPASRVLRLVGWGWGEGPHRQRLARGMTIDAVVRPNVSTYLGRESVEPELLDLRAR